MTGGETTTGEGEAGVQRPQLWLQKLVIQDCPHCPKPACADAVTVRVRRLLVHQQVADSGACASGWLHCSRVQLLLAACAL